MKKMGFLANVGCSAITGNGIQEVSTQRPIAMYMKKMGFLAYVDCSAKTGNGIKEVHTVCVDYISYITDR